MVTGQSFLGCPNLESVPIRINRFPVPTGEEIQKKCYAGSHDQMYYYGSGFGSDLDPNTTGSVVTDFELWIWIQKDHNGPQKGKNRRC